MKTVLVSTLAVAALCAAGTVQAAPDVTRTLVASPAVPASKEVSVENLLGHMTVSHGPVFSVKATVVAGGKDAQALAQSVKLEVSDAGGEVTVHVHYPIDRYTTYRYGTRNDGGDFCILRIFCFHGGDTYGLDYQGRHVRVASDGVPLHVDVAVQLPSGMAAQLVNQVGLLDAAGLEDSLALDTSGGDVSARQITGDLKADSAGGDVHVQALHGSLDADTAGGDAYVTQAAGATLRVRTGGGDAKLDGLNGSLDVGTAGGDLYLTHYVSGASVTLHTGGGDLQAAGSFAAARSVSIGTAGGEAVVKASRLAANVTADTGGGDLHLGGMTGGSLVADTAGGDAYLAGIAAPVRLHSGGGDAHLGGITGSLDAGTAGGDLYVTGFDAGPDVSLHTGGGYLQLAGNLAATRNLDVRTAGGNAALTVSGLSLHLQVSSDGGDIAVNLPRTHNLTSSSDHLTADIGNGQGRGSIRTDGGNVTLGPLAGATAPAATATSLTRG
ncbi:MAG TPA: DUF4097 family beta strand repeat-containing protein [Rhodanobacteraceae bacterium]